MQTRLPSSCYASSLCRPTEMSHEINKKKSFVAGFLTRHLLVYSAMIFLESFNYTIDLVLFFLVYTRNTRRNLEFSKSCGID